MSIPVSLSIFQQSLILSLIFLSSSPGTPRIKNAISSIATPARRSSGCGAIIIGEKGHYI